MDEKSKPGRFDYVAYDDIAKENQAAFKAMVQEIETHLAKFPGRYPALAMTALEEVYTWIGKAIRDDQIARGGSAADQPARSSG